MGRLGHSSESDQVIMDVRGSCLWYYCEAGFREIDVKRWERICLWEVFP